MKRKTEAGWRRRTRVAAAVLVAVGLLGSLTVSAQTDTVTVGVTTTAPTTGNPVATYLWEMSLDNGATWAACGTSTGVATTITVPLLRSVLVRVRGRDALNNVGVYSAVSDAYLATRGAPGACGKPAWQP